MSNHEDTLPLGTYYNQEYVAKLALKVLQRDGLLAYHNGETPTRRTGEATVPQVKARAEAWLPTLDEFTRTTAYSSWAMQYTLAAMRLASRPPTDNSKETP